MKFYLCEHHGNIITVLGGIKGPANDDGLQELLPGVTDAAQEKHVPLVKVEGSKVCVNVGEVEHPMSQEHLIEWVVLETDQGWQKKDLRPDTAPTTECALTAGEKPLAVYAYCNLHGLWKKVL